MGFPERISYGHNIKRVHLCSKLKKKYIFLNVVLYEMHSKKYGFGKIIRNFVGKIFGWNALQSGLQAEKAKMR